MNGPRPYLCQDCGSQQFCANVRGCLPKRCDDCAKKEDHCRTKRKRQRRRDAAQLNPVSRPWVCCDCGASAVRNSTRGKLPKRCKPCKLKQQRLRSAKINVHSRCTACGDNVVASGPRKLCGNCLAAFRKKETYKCIRCSKVTPVTGGKCARMYCSTDCAFTDKRESSLFIASLDDIIRRARANRIRREKTYGRLLEFVLKLLDNETRNLCLICRAPVKNPHGSHKDDYCSAECRRARKRQCKEKGSRKHTTRAKKKGLPRQYSITLPKVAERDGWMCMLCRNPVDRSLDHSHRMAASIDHVVPLNFPANTTHGHVWNNVQLAHRKCNEAKGCSIACPSLIDCIDPRKHVALHCIDQAHPTRGRSKKQKACLPESPMPPSHEFPTN